MDRTSLGQQLLLSHQRATTGLPHSGCLYWLAAFEGKRNGRTGREVSGRCLRHTADREPTCVTGEAGHYSRTLANKAGHYSRTLVVSTQNNHTASKLSVDQDNDAEQDPDGSDRRTVDGPMM